jgi:hypothetical protein
MHHDLNSDNIRQAHSNDHYWLSDSKKLAAAGQTTSALMV